MDLLDKFHIDQMNYDHQNIKPAMTILSNRVGIKNRKLKASLLLTLFLVNVAGTEIYFLQILIGV